MKNYVMYYLINSDLKMTKGKICAQIGHATVDLCVKLIILKNKDFKMWINNGQTKITLKSNLKEMEYLYNKYKNSCNYKCIQVIDAGKTQIEENSFTILAFQPCIKEDIIKEIPYLSECKLF